MKVRALETFMHDGKPVAKNSTPNMSEADAKRYIRLGKVVPAEAAAPRRAPSDRQIQPDEQVTRDGD